MEPTVADIMRKDFISFKKGDDLGKAIDVFLKTPDSVFPVVDERRRVIGEIGQHDLLRLAIPARYMDEGRILGPEGIREMLEKSGKKVADLMKTHEIKISQDTKIVDAVRIMLNTGTMTLEVVDKNGNPVGFVSELDILKYVKRTLEARK